MARPQTAAKPRSWSSPERRGRRSRPTAPRVSRRDAKYPGSASSPRRTGDFSRAMGQKRDAEPHPGQGPRHHRALRPQRRNGARAIEAFKSPGFKTGTDVTVISVVASVRRSKRIVRGEMGATVESNPDSDRWRSTPREGPARRERAAEVPHLRQVLRIAATRPVRRRGVLKGARRRRVSVLPSSGWSGS